MTIQLKAGITAVRETVRLRADNAAVRSVRLQPEPIVRIRRQQDPRFV